VTRADDIHLAILRKANTLSWPIKKREKGQHVKKEREREKDQHVELASKKKRRSQHFELASKIYMRSEQPMCNHRLKMFLKQLQVSG